MNSGHYRRSCTGCGWVEQCRCSSPSKVVTVFASCPHCPKTASLAPEERARLEGELAIMRTKPMSESSGQDGIEDLLYDDINPQALVAKVAARHAYASNYFKVGDPILFGKYKNKRGIIVKLYEDAKGHPTIDVQPVPQGRKKIKTIGLYKIWHDKDPPDPEEAEENAKSASERVAERYAAAEIGEQMFGRFKLRYLKQHEAHVEKLGGLLLEADKKYASAGVPIVHEIQAVLSGTGPAARNMAVYHMGSVPPTMQFAPKSFNDPNLLLTVIHELGHYFHDKVVPDGAGNREIILRHYWAKRQTSERAGGKTDSLTREIKLLEQKIEAARAALRSKPVPRKGQPVEWDEWINGTKYHIKGKSLGKRGTREIAVEIIEAVPGSWLAWRANPNRKPGPIVVPIDVRAFTSTAPTDAQRAELEKMDHELATLQNERTQAYKEPDDRYEVQLHDWLPTSYARKDKYEYFAEMLTALVLGHLKPEPAEWVKSVLKTGKAPEGMPL